MKRLYIVAAFAALAFTTGCVKTTVENNTVDVAEPELSISLPIGISRTAIDNEGRASWTTGDTFALWAEESAGDYALDGLVFKMTYYWHSLQSAVFSTITDGLAEGDYTYYAVAPKPTSQNGTKATFNLPAEQTGDSFNGVYDIMVATPLYAEALSHDKINNLALDFNHKMHVLKFNIAENRLGCDIAKLRFTFPTEVVGEVSVDVTNPIAAATLAQGSKNLNINMVEGGDKGDVVWGVIFPKTISGNVEMVAIGVDGGESINKTIALNKECVEGHITPFALTVPGVKATLRFSMGNNYLGEKIQKMTITDHTGASVVFPYNETNIYDYKVNSDDASAFDHYEGKIFTATFESANAIVSTTFTMPSALSNGINVIPAIDVPYLLFEDFSCIHTAGESYGDNKCAEDERKQPGVSLDKYMNHKGWNAARFLLGVGTCPRINVRYQMVKIGMQFQSSHHGRLDTPPMTALKSGANVKLRVQFDAGGVEYKGDFKGDDMAIQIATHTNLNNPIDGIPTGVSGVNLWPPGLNNYPTTLNDYGTTQFSQVMSSQYTLSSFGSIFPTLNAEIKGVTRDTRLVFYPTTSILIDGVGNDEFAIYIDNIRISIIPEEEEE